MVIPDHITREPEQVKAFRDTWAGWDSFVFDVFAGSVDGARDLLTESGSVFVQIGTRMCIGCGCDGRGVWGREFCERNRFSKSGGRSSEGVDGVYDLLLWYARNKDNYKFRKLLNRRTGQQLDTAYNYLHFEDGSFRMMSKSEQKDPLTIPDQAKRFRPNRIDSQTGGKSSRFTLVFENRGFSPPLTGGWRTTEIGFIRLARASRFDAPRTGTSI